MTTNLTIGRLAKATGINVETIRYYQRRGILDKPLKPLGSQRHYSTEHMKRLNFIKKAQALGFSLSEIGWLLQLDEGCMCGETRALTVLKLASIDQKMADFAILRDVLSKLVLQCDSNNNNAERCPIINVLEQD